MAITWQSVAAPQFGAANQQIDRGLNRINSGVQGVQDFVQGQANEQKAQTQEEFRGQLLDISVNPNISEKEMLGQALQLGRENDINTEDLLGHIDQVSGVREMAASLTDEQTNDVTKSQGAIEGLNEAGQIDIQGRLLAYDQVNPTSFANGLDAEYGAGMSAGQAMSELYGQLGGSQWITTKGGASGNQLQGMMNDWSEANPDVPGVVIAEAIKQTGVEEADWWGNDQFNLKRFESNVDRINEQYTAQKQNAVNRFALETNLNRTLQGRTAELQEQLDLKVKDYRADNIFKTFGK